MIQIKIFVFSEFQENTFVLHDETKKCVIIDAGCNSINEENIILRFIKENQLIPVKLLNTHCHLDHIFGNQFLKEKFNIPIIANEKDEFLIEQAVDHATFFGFSIEHPPIIDEYVDEGDLIEFGNSKLEILHTPGHSPGSIVFLNKDQKFAIVGDVLFNGSIGRTDLPGGNYNALINSIRKKLLSLDDDFIIYPGHGSETTIGEERLSNPFLI